MAKYKIVHHEDKCIGCGGCVSVCPQNWAMQGNKAKPKKTEITQEEYDCNLQAMEICPTEAIEIKKIED